MGSAGIPELWTTESGFMIDIRRGLAAQSGEKTIVFAVADASQARALRKGHRVAVTADDDTRREGEVWAVAAPAGDDTDVQVALDLPPQ